MTVFLYKDNPALGLLAQMLVTTEKTNDWKESCLDSLEVIGRRQLYDNLRLVENYEMLKGRFIFEHYLGEKDYKDMLSQMSQDFELLHNLKHYDIISLLVNILSGENQRRLDNFKVKGHDEKTTNEYIRQKTKLLTDFVKSGIDKEISQSLYSMGLDLEKNDFESEEEAQAYQQQIEETKASLTLPEIEYFMNNSWQDAAEIWGEYELESARQKYNLSEKEKKEFEDMLVSDRCFRHFFVKGSDYEVETWNLVATFFHKTKDTDYIEEGDYVGRILYMTLSAVIDRYGWLMTKKQIEKFRTNRDFAKGKNVRSDGIAMLSIILFEGYLQYKKIVEYTNWDLLAGGEATVDTSGLFGEDVLLTSRFGYIQVTEAYWKSQRKVGKFNYLDEEGFLQSFFVDDTFVVLEGVSVVEGTFQDSNEANTIVWTWINEVWKGVKLTLNLDNQEQAEYLDVRLLDFQFKGDNNLYGVKLLVCGQIFNNRNGDSASFVDLVKSFQIGHNIAMNQLVHILEIETLKFMLMDTNLILKLKGWGGERGWEKIMTVAKELTMALVNSSLENMEGANASNSFLREIDLDQASRLMSRVKIADYFEMKAMKQIGINEQRIGNLAASETATGINQAISQSYASTESYFTNFSNYKKRCYTMMLDIAQFVQSQKESVTLTYTKSDLSRAFLQLNGTELLLRDLKVFVSKSDEDMRQLELLRQLAMNNNTSDATMLDLATIIRSNSPSEIVNHLRVAENRRNQMQKQQQQQEQKSIEQQRILQQEQQQFEANENQLDRDMKLEIAYMQTFSRQDENLKDSNNDSTLDVLEYSKFALDNQNSQNSNALSQRKQQLDEVKEANKNKQFDAQMILKQKEMSNKLQIEKEKLKVAKENKTKAELGRKK